MITLYTTLYLMQLNNFDAYIDNNKKKSYQLIYYSYNMCRFDK